MNFSWLVSRMKEIVDKYLYFRYKGHFKKSQCKKNNSILGEGPGQCWFG